MAKWTASQFGVTSKGISNIPGTDFNRTTTSSDTKATKSGEISGMADSLSTKAGQTSMGDSRATKA